MKLLPLALCLGMAATNALASPDDDKKACIIESARKLPVIAGLQITNASATLDSKPLNKDDGDGLWLVDIDFTAAGQSVRYSFSCAMLPTGNPMSQRTK